MTLGFTFIMIEIILLFIMTLTADKFSGYLYLWFLLFILLLSFISMLMILYNI